MYLASCGLLLADGLPQPSGPVILAVTGNIQHTNAQDDNGEGKAEFDREILESLGTTELEAETLWTMGRPVFEGVKAIDVMNTVGNSRTTVKAIALNTQIPAILITGDAALVDAQDVKALGCLLLHKPVKGDELVEMIQELLPRQKGLRRSKYPLPHIVNG